MLPDGVGYGWDYAPGDKWERGLVPSALIDEAGGLTHSGRHLVQIDKPRPMEELLVLSKPFVAKPLQGGLSDEDYVRGFLKPFGADIGQAVLWEDKAGAKIPISEQFFQDRSGMWKVNKRDRGRLTPLMAEALMDPDEIWLGIAAKPDPVIYEDECGIELPSYGEVYGDPAEAEEIERALAEREPWSDWRRVEQPRPFDLALFTRGGWRSHVGIIVQGRQMLHMPRSGACIVHLDRSRWGQRLAGIYRHREMEDRL